MRLPLFAVLAALTFVSPALGQNTICPTAANGDNSNKCASTGFVQNAFGAGSPTESANTFFAGPTSGLAAPAGWRLLVGADLPLFTSSQPGAVPSSGGGTVNFLRADGAFAVPPGSLSGLTTNGVLYASSTTAAASTAAMTNGQLLIGQTGAAPAPTTLATPLSLTAAGTLNYTQPATGGTARTLGSKLADIISVVDFGAACNGSTNDATAIQNAINAVPVGGILLIKSNCNVGSTLTIASPMTVMCGGSNGSLFGSITETAAGVDAIDINSNWVTIRDCYINRSGTPSGTAAGIAIGTDSKSITDGTCSNGSTTFTSTSQASFTSADVGKRIAATSCGTSGATLFATISVFTNSTTVTLSIAASCAGGCPAGGAAIAKYGFSYTDVVIENVNAVNHIYGVHVVDAARFHINNSYFTTGAGNGTGGIGCFIEDQVAIDFGDAFLSNTTCETFDQTTGYAIQHISGGGLKIVNNKFLGGLNGVYLNWSLGVTGAPYLTNNSIENCSGSGSAILATAAAQMNFLIIGNNEINCGSPNIKFAAGATVINGAAITGNTITGGGGTCLDIAQANNVTVTGNLCNSGGGNPAINIRSTCGSCIFSGNNIVGATTRYTNSSTTSYVYGESFTWTPVLAGTSTAGAPTYAGNGQVGSYEVDNRLVTARGLIITTALGGPTGNMQITGLPVTSANVTNDVAGCSFHYMAGVTLDASYVTLTGIIAANATAISLYENGSGQAGQPAPVGKFAAATTLEFACQYHF